MNNFDKVIEIEKSIVIYSPESLEKSRQCLDNIINILDENNITTVPKHIVGLAAHVYAMVERCNNCESVIDIDDELVDQVDKKYKQLAQKCIESLGKDFRIQNYKSELFLMAVHIQNLAERKE